MFLFEAIFQPEFSFSSEEKGKLQENWLNYFCFKGTERKSGD